jgi:hypothetical protein
MPSPIFRKHATDLVLHAVNKAESATQITHNGMRGTVREIAADELFQPFLTANFQIGTGKITDAEGRQSDQTDLVVYNPSLLPPVLLRHNGPDGVFPVEACF